jgi:hypothetical protein
MAAKMKAITGSRLQIEDDDVVEVYFRPILNMIIELEILKGKHDKVISKNLSKKCKDD